MGSDYSSKIYKHLREEEVEQLTIEIATMKDLSPESMEEVVEEFYNLCLAQKYVSEGGIEYAKEILDKAFGIQNSTILIDKVTKTLKTKAFDFLKKIDSKYLLAFIENEHPQTVALILSYLRPDQASSILIELPREMQLEVTERIATMDRTSPDVVKEVEAALESKFSSVMSVGLSEIGGVNHIAEVLNEVDRATEKFILEELMKTEPDLSEKIRKKMFVFEDIVTLDPPTIQRFLQEVEPKDLLIALKGTSDDVAEVFYNNMSSRMSETMREDAQYIGGVRISMVEEAQQKLVDIIRKLEDSGEIFISRGGKDEIIV